MSASIVSNYIKSVIADIHNEHPDASIPIADGSSNENPTLTNFEKLFQRTLDSKGLGVSWSDDRYIVFLRDPHVPVEDEILNHFIGPVFDRKTHECISPTFSKTIEITPDEFKSRVNSEDMSGLNWIRYREGSVLRVYYWNDTWCVSTNRKVNAQESSWNSGSYDTKLHYTRKNFVDLFNDCHAHIPEIRSSENPTEAFYDALNKKHQYSFLMCHPSSPRLVHGNNSKYLYCVSVYDTEADQFINDQYPFRSLVPDTMSVENREAILNEVIYSVDTTGGWTNMGIVVTDFMNRRYVCFHPIYKIMKEYMNCFLNVEMRYLVDRKNGKVCTFNANMPPFIQLGQYIEKCIKMMKQNLYDLYVVRFITKEAQIYVHPVYLKELFSLHKMHKEQGVKINYAKINEYIDTMEAKDLYRILKKLGQVS